MKIQILTNGATFERTKECELSSLNKPKSFDEFDFNIIDLDCGSIWNFDTFYDSFTVMKQIIEALSKIIKNSNTNKTIIMIPQDIKILEYTRSTQTGRFYYAKDTIDELCESLDELVGFFPRIRYEHSKTTIDEYQFSSDFVFNKHTYKTIKQTDGGKDILIQSHTDKNIYITTLKITDNEKLRTIINFIQSQNTVKTQSPEWLNGLYFFDDKKLIDEREHLLEVYKQIEYIDKKLEINNKFKSILYSTGEELVGVVKEILTNIFNLENISFIDKKKEDFRFKHEDINFIIEIKGINENIQNKNIAQCEEHVSGFISKNNIEDITKVKGLLIINPERKTQIDKRNQTHETQKEFAKKKDILIIKTIDLLKLYQAYQQKEISTEQCFEIFKDKTGEFIYEYKDTE